MNIGNVGASSAAEEAMESAAQTRAEAGQGDSQAMRRMANQNAQNVSRPAITTGPSGRETLDSHA